MPARLLVAAHSLLAYLGKMILPLNLRPFYPYPQHVSFLSMKYGGAVVLVISITAACVALAKKQKLWLTVWSYYVITLIPVLGVVQVGAQALADRYTYLPSIGPFIAVGAVAGWIWERTTASEHWRLSSRLLGSTIAAGVLIVLTYMTFAQIGIWKDSIRLWSFVINEEPGKVPLAYNQRGMAYYEIGRLDLAKLDFDRAITLNPSYYDASNNLGMTLYKMGDLDDAMREFDRTIALNASSKEAYNNRGMIFNDKGQLQKALEDFKMAVTLDPAYYNAYANLGTAYGKAGMFDQAIESFDRSIAISPNFFDAYYNRALTYTFMGQQGRAIDDFSEAIKLDAKFGLAYLNRGKLYLQAGRKYLAVPDLQKACDMGYKAGCDVLREATKE